MRNLNIRLTHKYVGTCKHMDDWENIGTVEELSLTEIPSGNEDGLYESGDQINLVRVVTSRGVQKIKQALKDTFTSTGCACSHDCCGCKSIYVRGVTRLDKDKNIWAVELHWYRNI